MEVHFPKLKFQNGTFELLRPDRGGHSHLLINIDISSKGQTIKQLGEVVPGSTIIHLRPIKSDLDMMVLQNAAGEKAYTLYVNCHKNVPLVGIKEHADLCYDGNSTFSTDVLTEAKTQTETKSSDCSNKGQQT